MPPKKLGKLCIVMAILCAVLLKSADQNELRKEVLVHTVQDTKEEKQEDNGHKRIRRNSVANLNCGEYQVLRTSPAGTLIVDLFGKTGTSSPSNFAIPSLTYWPTPTAEQRRSGLNLMCNDNSQHFDINEPTGYICITSTGKLKRRTNFSPTVGARYDLSVTFNDRGSKQCTVKIQTVEFISSSTVPTIMVPTLFVTTLSSHPGEVQSTVPASTSSYAEASTISPIKSTSVLKSDIPNVAVTDPSTSTPFLLKTGSTIATSYVPDAIFSTALSSSITETKTSILHTSDTILLTIRSVSSYKQLQTHVVTASVSSKAIPPQQSCSLVFSTCKVDEETRESALSELENTTVTAANASSVALQLANLTSDDQQSLNFEALRSIIGILESLLPYSGNNSNVTISMVQTIDNYLKGRSDEILQSQRQFNTSTRILSIIGELGEKIAIHQSGDFIQVGDEFALAATYENPTSFNGITAVYRISKSRSNKNEFDIDRNYTVLQKMNQSFPEASISLPKQISFKSKQSRFILVFTVYDQGKLFQSKRSGELNSKVISAEVRNLKIKQLSEPVVTTLERTNMDKNKPICSWWDISKADGQGGWSQDNCQAVENINQITTCHCSHLTNFAVLFGAEEPDKRHKLALSIITLVGCGVSLFGALATVITYAIFRELRKTNPPKILLNLCIAYVLMLVVYIAGVPRTESRHGCQAVAFILQYFQTCVFTWCAVEGFASYRGIVRPMDTEIEKFIWKAIVFAWGTPVILPTIGIAVWPEKYGDERSCVVTGYPFYITLLPPIILVLIMNYIALVSIIFALQKSSERYKHNPRGFRDRLRIIAVFTSLFGLTWTFGFLVLSNDIVAFQYILCIISGSHGLFIFLYYVVRNEKVRKLWSVKLGLDSSRGRVSSASTIGDTILKSRLGTDTSFAGNSPNLNKTKGVEFSNGTYQYRGISNPTTDL